MLIRFEHGLSTLALLLKCGPQSGSIGKWDQEEGVMGQNHDARIPAFPLGDSSCCHGTGLVTIRMGCCERGWTSLTLPASCHHVTSLPCRCTYPSASHHKTSPNTDSKSWTSQPSEPWVKTSLIPVWIIESQVICSGHREWTTIATDNRKLPGRGAQ